MNMKFLLALILSLSFGTTATADESQTESQAGYSRSRTCTKNEYREEYFPGTEESPGYVKSWTETIEVPCNTKHSSTHNSIDQSSDNNDCKEGSIIGGLLGAGITMSSTRGKDRWWAVPAGGATGAVIGCSIDGG